MPETHESTLERFERIAEQFRRDTGYLAPGKDVAADMSYAGYEEERLAAWETWCEQQRKRSEMSGGER